MPMSTITIKGQTTIPKSVRDALHLKPNDKLFYVVQGNAVMVRPIHGTIVGLKGIFKGAIKGPLDFKQLREETKRIVAKRVLERMR